MKNDTTSSAAGTHVAASAVPRAPLIFSDVGHAPSLALLGSQLSLAPAPPALSKSISISPPLLCSPATLLVRDIAGNHRPAHPNEILAAAQNVLACQIYGPQLPTTKEMKDFLRVKLGSLQYEIFAVMHLDSGDRLIEYVEMFRGSLRESSVYPREVVKDALARNSSSLVLVHNHPSAEARPSRADEMLTATLKHALALVDIRVSDHLIVTRTEVVSMDRLGLM